MEGVVAAVGSALPLVIVSARPFIPLSSSTLPVIPRTTSIRRPCDTVVVESCLTSVSHNSVTSTGTVVVANVPGLLQRHLASVSGVPSGTKPVPRLSRLDAMDLSITSATDSDVTVLSVTSASFAIMQSTQPFTASSQTIGITFTAADGESSEGAEVERVIPRREITPIPGAVCSAEEAARVGSSYLCSFCGKTFSSAPQLAVHRNIHFFERQFRCPVCRSLFASRTALEHHRSKEHHGELESVISADPRPYKCDECGVAFRIQGHLAKHKRSKVHAARLETSQDLSGTADAEDSSGALPLTVDEAETAETELDEFQHEASCQEEDSVPVHEQEHVDSGEVNCLSYVRLSCVPVGQMLLLDFAGEVVLCVNSLMCSGVR